MAEEKKDQLKDALKILKPFLTLPFRPPVNVPGTINESRRAQALWRSLYKNVQSFPGTEASLTTEHSPAIGRRATLATKAPSGNRKLPTSSINFFSVDPQYSPSTNRYFNTFGTGDKPFRGGLKDAKLQGLLYQLGDLFERMPAGSVSGAGTDQQRRTAYQRLTGGALGPEGDAFIRPDDGRFQPRDEKGRLGKAVPNPSKRLQAGLSRLASGNVVRAAAPFAKNIPNLHPGVQAFINLDDMLRQMTGKGFLERNRDQVEKTLKKDPTINLAPLLPF